MGKYFVLFASITYFASRISAEDCQDPRWCTLVGADLCKTNAYVRNGCKTKCGICNVEILCPEIERTDHADIRITPQSRKTGAVANFTCDPGFQLNGPRTITCLDTGEWSDSKPYCSVRKCRRDLTKVDSGRKCGKRCRRDSECKGVGKKCQCDDWCGKSCFNPNEDCPQLLEPEHGHIVANGWTYGKSVTYSCDDGFLLAGLSSRRCRSDGKWDGDSPICVAYGACGQSDNTGWSVGKVMNGHDAKQGSWPWQALLMYDKQLSVKQIYDTSSGFAGGSIINEEWILSASHIFTDVFPESVKNSVWKDTFLIVLGMTKRPKGGATIPGHIQIFTPRSVYLHPRFDEGSFDYDVALIRVGKRMKRGPKDVFVFDGSSQGGKISFSRLVRPVCLPCMAGSPLQPVDVLKDFNEMKCNPADRQTLQQYTAKGSSVIVTGFGRKSDKNKIAPDNLQQGNLTVLGNQKCVDSVRDIKRQREEVRFTDRMFCAKGGNKTARVDSCKGDSGGPVVKKITTSKAAYWLQIGIVSWGVPCGGEKHPGFYVSVPSIMTWLWKTLDDATYESTTCSEKMLPERGHYNITSCPSGKTIGSKCAVQCESGYQFSNGEKVWTPTCGFNMSDRRHAVWGNFTNAPACEEIKCREKVLDGDQYTSQSCLPAKVGSKCSVRCKAGYRFNNGDEVWTSTCELSPSNSGFAEWSSNDPPDCQECKELSWCWRVKGMCKINSFVRNHCMKTCEICKRGTWDQWTLWSGCTATCNGGERTRIRSCRGPGTCDGKPTQSQICNSQNCEGVWSRWTVWGICSVTCGGGVRARARSCLGPGVCTGERTESLDCNTPKCPDVSAADRLVKQLEGVLQSMSKNACTVSQYLNDLEDPVKRELDSIISENGWKANDRQRVRVDKQRVLSDQRRYSDNELTPRYREALVDYRAALVGYESAVNAYESTLQDIFQATVAYKGELLKCESGSSEYAAALTRYRKAIGQYQEENRDYVKAFYDYVRAHNHYCTCLQEVNG